MKLKPIATNDAAMAAQSVADVQRAREAVTQRETATQRLRDEGDRIADQRAAINRHYYATNGGAK